MKPQQDRRKHFYGKINDCSFSPAFSSIRLKDFRGRRRKERGKLTHICTYLSMCPGYPAVTRIHGNNEASSRASQIPATRAVFTKIRRSALRGGTGFCSTLFCRCSDFGRAFRTRIRPRIRFVSAMSNAAVIADQPARQSSRTRYAVGRSLHPSGQTTGSECRLFRTEWIWPLGRDRIGLPPGMSLNGNHRIEGLIFDDRRDTYVR